MPYAPTVNDNSGEIIARAVTGASNTQLRGQELLADGISKGAANITSGAAGAIGSAVEAREENAALDMTYEYLKAKSPGLFGKNTDKKFYEGNIGAKRALVSQGQTVFMKDLQLEGQKAYLGEQARTNLLYQGAKNALTPAPTTADLDQMSEAGYAWDHIAKKFVPDRSKYRSVNPMDALLSGDPNADLPNSAPGSTPPPAAPSRTPAPVAPTNGQTIVNRQTGQRMMLQNGQWVPVK